MRRTSCGYMWGSHTSSRRHSPRQDLCFALSLHAISGNHVHALSPLAEAYVMCTGIHAMCAGGRTSGDSSRAEEEGEAGAEAGAQADAGRAQMTPGAQRLGCDVTGSAAVGPGVAMAHCLLRAVDLTS